MKLTESKVVPKGQIHPQKYLPKGMVRINMKKAQMKVLMKARAETIDEIARRGSILKKKSTGILNFKGYVAERKRRRKNRTKNICEIRRVVFKFFPLNS